MNSLEFDPKMSFIIIHLLGFPEKNEFLTDFLNDVTIRQKFKMFRPAFFVNLLIFHWEEKQNQGSYIELVFNLI